MSGAARRKAKKAAKAEARRAVSVAAHARMRPRRPYGAVQAKATARGAAASWAIVPFGASKSTAVPWELLTDGGRFDPKTSAVRSTPPVEVRPAAAAAAAVPPTTARRLRWSTCGGCTI